MIRYDLPMRIIEFNASNPQNIRFVDFTEDEFYDLLAMAFSTTKLKTVSKEKNIYQVSYPITNSMTASEEKLYEAIFNKRPELRYVERVFKLVDGVPAGFTAYEANKIVENFLRRTTNE